MKQISKKLEGGLAIALAFLMGLMVVDVTWQVLTRFILTDPSSYTEELARFLLMWIGLVGAAYAFRKHSHLSLNLIMLSASPERKRLLVRFSQSMCFLFSASVMVFGGAKLMLLTLSLEQISPALNIPIGYVYSCIPISGLLICWFALDAIIDPEEAIQLSIH